MYTDISLARAKQRLENTFRLTPYHIRTLDLLKGKDGRLLELGCANGFFLGEIKKRGFICKGVEIVPKFVQAAKKIGLDVTLSNLENGIPFEDNSFDIVIAHEIIEHIVRFRFLISEIRRVLKKEGIAIVSVPNCSYWRIIISLILGEPMLYKTSEELPSHMVHLSLKQWKRIFWESFRSVELQHIGNISSRFPFSLFPLYFQRHALFFLSDRE